MAVTTEGRFRLHVPLDASSIRDFKPDKRVKVVALDSAGRGQEHTVQLSADGKGNATFSFAARPSVVRVVVGPEDATVAELQALQTISVSISPRAWQDSDTLTLSPLRSAHATGGGG